MDDQTSKLDREAAAQSAQRQSPNQAIANDADAQTGPANQNSSAERSDSDGASD